MSVPFDFNAFATSNRPQVCRAYSRKHGVHEIYNTAFLRMLIADSPVAIAMREKRFGNSIAENPTVT